jgi:hypothetical protein
MSGYIVDGVMITIAGASLYVAILNIRALLKKEKTEPPKEKKDET